ncbi:glycosyltransferase family 2 protein [Cyclobacteriaceae bacterium YHN15]|nr:glycosyltransferase family 2 protein [Cyclobacteriaceae bacterium YHN15]
MALKLNVLVSTIDDGIEKIKNLILPPRLDVNYIVSHQYTDEKFKSIPIEIKRSDILVSQIPGKGVTKSRNNTIRLTKGDIAVFSDDDVSYTFEFFDNIIDTFKSNPNLDVGIFKIKTPEGQPEYKEFPKEVIHYKKKAPSAGTIQIAFRVNPVLKKNLFFDERFGAGNTFLIGSDEQIFLQDCINAGLIVKYFPEYIVIHPYESTVKSIPHYDNRRIRVTGGLDARTNGPISIIKAFFGTVKFLPDLIKHRKNPLVYFWERFRAAVYIIFSRN